MTVTRIRLSSHNSEWKELFCEESQALRNLLGASIVRISHVGSTSIPDIKAKPILDIVVESKTFPPTEIIIDSLHSMEYENKGESNVPGRCWFIKGNPRFNLHWCPSGGVVPLSQIAFRDKLRSNDELARQYEQIKMAAAPGQEIDSESYAAAKSEFIARVLAQ